jgi:hypothetical protein
MASVNFVERLNNVHRVPDTDGEWESGYWVVAEDAAQRLVGGNLYLYSSQSEPSHFGGEILSSRVHRDEAIRERDGRVVFRIKFTMGHRGVAPGREGWGNEKKFVW